MNKPVLCAVAMLMGVAVTRADGQAKETKLRCAAPGFTATYSPAGRGVPASVDVTYRGRRPTSASAQQALTKCLKEVADTMFVTDEVLGTAWFGTTKDNDKPITLADGSSNMVYNPKSKRVMTWNEREGKGPPAITEGPGYFVKYEEEKILVKPGGTFASISVVFPAMPSEKRAFEAVIAEATKAVQRTRSSMSVTAYAFTGRQRTDAGSWHQVRGSSGKFISAEFDPKRPGHLYGPAGEDLGVQIK